MSAGHPAFLCFGSHAKELLGDIGAALGVLAVLTPEYAKKIGADWYAKDAKRSADIAKEFFGV